MIPNSFGMNSRYKKMNLNQQNNCFRLVSDLFGLN